MNWKILVSALLFFSTIFSGCKKEDPYLNIVDKSVTIEDAGGTQTITISTNQRWSATVTGDWCEITPQSGKKGETKMSIVSSPNDTYGERKCTITITTELFNEEIELTQKSNYGVILSKDKFDLTDLKQTIHVEVQANVEYTVGISQDWIQQIPTKALTASTIDLEVSQNYLLHARDAVITISYPESAETITIPVHQAALEAPAFVDASSYGVYYHKSSIGDMIYQRFIDQISLYSFSGSYSFKVMNFKSEKYFTIHYEKDDFEIGELVPLSLEDNYLGSKAIFVDYNAAVLQIDGHKVWLYDIAKKVGFIIKHN